MAYKTFESFTKLAADDVNSYLMKQSVMVFADATERDAALPTGTVTEGMIVYLTGLNQIQVNINGTTSGWYVASGQMPSFVGLQTGAMTAQASGATTKVTLTFSSKTERGITESSGIVTVPYTGWYHVTGVINWASGAAGNRDCILAYGVSGTYTEFAMTRIYAGVTGTNYTNATASMYLTAGNTIRLQGSQTSGATLSMTGAVIPCSLTVNYLGA